MKITARVIDKSVYRVIKCYPGYTQQWPAAYATLEKAYNESQKSVARDGLKCIIYTDIMCIEKGEENESDDNPTLGFSAGG